MQCLTSLCNAKMGVNSKGAHFLFKGCELKINLLKTHHNFMIKIRFAK